MTEDEFSALLLHSSERPEAREALAPYRVRNAILLAAGTGSRLAPLTDKTPKGLLRVRGERLVERQIRQLQAAGIDEIVLVVGHLKEQFAYLADEMGVHIVENPDYRVCNNTSSLYRVLDFLDNSYICSADNYFTENVFTPYVYRSYYAAVYSDVPTREYYLTTNGDGRITEVNIGGAHGWYMLGQVYWSRSFSSKFRALLREEYAEESVRQMLWEQFYMRHIEELALYQKSFSADVIHEFDTLADILAFDANFGA
ncbi:NTP transferase domain-containing protein [Selenomonas sp. F0473]|uniref:NTP transferase domain-containing protein n=1 Tax=Selenomonas sp. F0473 TaxID=999423 RepID=UPI00029E012C|nr:NTP transferase domain-containing protein [Selenomonas sp. F0473]EKU72052.1 hypothetical protein HMPREF9161_00737 [Selenomonas sp. F0473]